MNSCTYNLSYLIYMIIYRWEDLNLNIVITLNRDNKLRRQKMFIVIKLYG